MAGNGLFTCLSVVQHNECSVKVCEINEVKEVNQTRSHLPEY